MIVNLIYVLIAGILLFVLYLAVKAITRGVEAKGENNSDPKIDQEKSTPDNNLTEELIKINNLHKDGVLDEEEFKKAKEKLLKK
tara:strand:- start:202 stop:453 length:252 start_codon:yes stop_codon:yes gene_type:complete